MKKIFLLVIIMGVYVNNQKSTMYRWPLHKVISSLLISPKLLDKLAVILMAYLYKLYTGNHIN